MRLGDDLLRAVSREAHHASPGVGDPEGPVSFGEDAFGPLKSLADEREVLLREGEAIDGFWGIELLRTALANYRPIKRYVRR